MTDFATQRLNMVESQVRPSDITDRRILGAMLGLPREQFLPEALRALAYSESDLRLPPGETGERRLMPNARTLAKLIQLAEIDAGDRVLNLAAGTGYGTAILARLAGHVIAVESDAHLVEHATRVLQAVGATNAEMVRGTLTEGWPRQAPYDAIIIEGGVGTIPDALIDQLKDGGRLVAIRMTGRLGKATVWQRVGTQAEGRASFDCASEMLASFAQESQFVL